MKWIGMLFALGVFIAVAIAGVFWVQIRPSGYPFEETLRNAEGKTAVFEVIGRSADDVYAYRADDPSDAPEWYALPLADLDVKTRLILKTLPEKAPPAVVKEEPPYVANRKKEIARLKRNLEELVSERDAATSGEKRIGPERKWEAEISRIEAEIGALEEAIQEYVTP